MKTFSASSAERLMLVDLMRSASILVVMASHFSLARLFTHTNTVQDFIRAPLWNILAWNGTCGVSLFFLISGFLITNRFVTRFNRTVETVSLREFYSHRAARLFPLLLLMIGVGFLVPYCITNPSSIVMYGFAHRVAPPGLYVAITTFTFNFYILVKALHGHYPGAFWLIFWSLSIEEQFYFFYPLLLRRMKRTRRILWLLGTVVLSGLLWRTCAYRALPQSLELSLYSSLGAFDQIALGCLLSFVLRLEIVAVRTWRYLLFVSGAALLILTYWKAPLYFPLNRIYAPLLVDTGLFLLLLGGLQWEWPQGPLTRLACLPGKLSYGMYLWHIIVLVLGWNLLKIPSIWLGFGVFVVLTTGVASISYVAYERPANRRVRRLFEHPA